MKVVGAYHGLDVRNVLGKEYITVSVEGFRVSVRLPELVDYFKSLPRGKEIALTVAPEWRRKKDNSWTLFWVLLGVDGGAG